MKSTLKVRRTVVAFTLFLITLVVIACHPNLQQPTVSPPISPTDSITSAQGGAVEALNKIAVKGRAPKTGYERQQFGDGWDTQEGCDMRNRILRRDLTDITFADDGCKILTGKLYDKYTGKMIAFKRGDTTSDDVQIDHVVALSNAWQTGAQALTREQRIQFANDPLELKAVEGAINQKKGDADAATWLPPNKTFRCEYVATQIAIKAKYQLWVTQGEKDAMLQVLSTCPGQALPTAK